VLFAAGAVAFGACHERSNGAGATARALYGRIEGRWHAQSVMRALERDDHPGCGNMNRARSNACRNVRFEWEQTWPLERPIPSLTDTVEKVVFHRRSKFF
jgi:hypothetical protein